MSLYSDLLLHDMGPGLADGIAMGSATGSEWRTTPLWGISHRRFFLHDGRAHTLQEAILAHDGEAQAARIRFAQLRATDRDAVLAALGRFTNRLDEFRTLLEAGDGAGLVRWLTEAKQVRDALGT